MQESAVLRRALDAAHHLNDETPPWQDLLQGFCELAGGDSANFIMFDGADQLVMLERQGGDARAERDYLAHWHAHDIMTPLTRGAGVGAWLDSEEMFTSASLSRSAFYNDFMCTHDMRQIAVFVVDASPSCRAGVSIQRSHRTARLRTITHGAPMQRLSLALQRSILERRERAAIAMTGLDAAVEPFGDMAFLLSPSGVVLYATPSTMAWVERCGALSIVAGCLQHRDPAWQAAWCKALHDAVHGGHMLTLALPAAPGLAHRLQLVRADSKFSLRGEPQVLVRVNNDRSGATVHAHLLRMAFGISPMEAEVLAALTSGLQPKQVAAMHGVSISTVRTQISSLMVQLGCKRQADLVRKACALL